MQLEKAQLQAYEEKGFILLPNCFSQAEVNVMKAELPTILTEDTPRKALEKTGKSVRFVYASHTDNEVFRRLSQHPRLVEPAKQIVGSKVYIHKFRINCKAAFHGDVWHWHQDYVYWKEADGMPAPRAISVLVFLDEVTEFNGPVDLIPGSHRQGIVDYVMEDEQHSAYEQSSPQGTVLSTTTLKYSTEPKTVAGLAAQYGIEAAKGPAGAVLFIHPQCVHGSAPNFSPFNRSVVVITYSSIENTLLDVENPRPEFVTNRNYKPVESLSQEILLV